MAAIIKHWIIVTLNYKPIMKSEILWFVNIVHVNFIPALLFTGWNFQTNFEEICENIIQNFKI